MGPGSRRDTLDDHFNDWNWKKILGFGKLFQYVIIVNTDSTIKGAQILSKIQDAVPARSEHQQALKDFESSIQPAILMQW